MIILNDEGGRCPDSRQLGLPATYQCVCHGEMGKVNELGVGGTDREEN